MVVGHAYLVIKYRKSSDGLRVLEKHVIRKDKTCALCKEECDGAKYVVQYLSNGGQRAPDREDGSIPDPTHEQVVAAQLQWVKQQEQQWDACPICGAEVELLPHRIKRTPKGTEVVRDRPWRCSEGGFAHYYEARYGHVKEWLVKEPSEPQTTEDQGDLEQLQLGGVA